MSYKQNNAKNAIHGFFIAVATTVAEQNSILPLIVHHFTSNLIIVGLFATLLRGGAILAQLFAAFYAQSFQQLLPYLRIVFLFRFLSWFFIGFCIYFIGDSDKTLTLWLIGTGLFFFSFSAGFGGVYFKEIIAKCFSKEERGKTMANKQFFASLGSLISGGIAGIVLESFDEPISFAYLFMLSALLMSIGLITFSTIDEPVKENISPREESFKLFLKNAYKLLKSDLRLRVLISIILSGYSFLFALPFVILHAKESIDLSGAFIGMLITIQMIGSMAGNLFLWKRLTQNYIKMMQVALSLMIVLFTVALFAKSKFAYFLIFFLFGVARDGFRNAQMNSLLEIAPESKRSVYIAIESTISSIGYFFSIIGGFILEFGSYTVLYLFTLFILTLSLSLTRKLNLLNQ